MASSITSIMLGLIAVLAIMVGVLFFITLNQKRKLRTFMTGKDGSSLEATLAWLTDKSARTDETLSVHKEGLELIDERVKRSIRGYSLVRYNAYGDAGGIQSFATGLLDEHQDGYILSVITNRNHVGVYAKKINRGVPDTTLTTEETDALQEAKKSLNL